MIRRLIELVRWFREEAVDPTDKEYVRGFAGPPPRPQEPPK